MLRHKSVWMLMLFLLLAVPALAQSKAGDVKMTPYVFENSKKEKIDAELGVLLVPENRRQPHSNLIELAFVRFKTTSPNPGPPIVYLAGGPGSSGVASAKGARFPLFMAMREIGDVIAFDQRGTGMSKPNLSCYERWDLPLDAPPSRELLVRIARERSRDCAAYWRDWQRVDLAGYHTDESADDLEDLRKALGAKQLSLWGISYGTHLGLTMLRRHPHSIHRAMLAGIEGPDHSYKLPSNIQKHLADLARAVKSDPTLNQEIPDFLDLMKTVLHRLEKEPATVEVIDPQTKQKIKVTVNKFALQFLTVSNIGTTVTSTYPAIYHAAAKGDYSMVAEAWLNQTRQGFGSAMSYMMDCASGITATRRARIAREAQETLLEDLTDIVIPAACDAWGNPDLGDDFRAPIKSNVPTLFISGTLDARTPVSNAEETRAGFTNSVHLIIEGAVHSDPLFLASPKIREVMLEFMRGVRVSTERIELPPLRFVALRTGATN